MFVYFMCIQITDKLYTHPYIALIAAETRLTETRPRRGIDMKTTRNILASAFAVAGGSLTGIGEDFRLMVVDATAYPWQVSEVLPN